MISRTLMLARGSETVTELWRRAITEGERRANIVLGSLLEEHLAMTLRSHLRDIALCREIARELLELRGDAEGLIRTAGRCLLISGLFPALARRRNVPVGYFAEIGVGAYHAHALYWIVRGRHGYAECSRSAAERFPDLVGTLLGMKNSPTIAEEIQALFTAYSRWN